VPEPIFSVLVISLLSIYERFSFMQNDFQRRFDIVNWTTKKRLSVVNQNSRSAHVRKRGLTIRFTQTLESARRPECNLCTESTRQTMYQSTRAVDFRTASLLKSMQLPYVHFSQLRAIHFPVSALGMCLATLRTCGQCLKKCRTSIVNSHPIPSPSGYCNSSSSCDCCVSLQWPPLW
jgi:hypothetical protein